MNPRSTLWLVGLAMTMFLFIVLVERPGSTPRPGGPGIERLLPNFDPRRVTSLRIRLGTNTAISLERATNRWFFRAPLAYPAESDQVDRFLSLVSGATYRGRIKETEVARQTNGLAAFGLMPSRASLTLGRTNERAVIELGGATAIGGLIYAQVSEHKELYTLDASFLEAIPRAFDDWRDRTLLNLSAGAFDQLQVRPLTNGFEVVRRPESRKWRMTRPLPTPADSARIEYLIHDLAMLRVQTFVEDRPDADLAAFGLQPPQRELAFRRGTNDLLTLQIGQAAPHDTNLVYLRSSVHSNVVLVSRRVLEPWFDRYREFCDRRLMVFNLEEVHRLVATTDEPFSVERSTHGAWRITSPFQAPADEVLMLEAFAELISVEFLEFEREVATDFTGYGLDPPRRQYRLERTPAGGAGATNEVLARLDIGDPSGHLYYMRRSREDSVLLGLDPTRLPRAAFQLRDRRLWNVGTNDLAALVVSEGGRSRRLVRTGPMQWALGGGEGGPPNPVTLEEAAFRVGHLRAERWVAWGDEALERYGFKEGGHEITLELRPGLEPPRRTLRFGRPSPAGRMYAAVALEGQPGPVVFECPPSIYEFVTSDLSLPRPEAGAGP